MSDRAIILRRLDGAAAAVAGLRGRVEEIHALAAALVEVVGAGGTLFTAGNGGSAAQALHLSEELVGRYRAERPPVRAVCLCADAPALTCIANDFGYEQVFARQCRALLRGEDALVVLSTSGDSANLVEALRLARGRGALTAGLLGRGGGRCAELCDHAVVVEATDSAHVQEAHQVLLHLICELVEAATVGP